MRQGAPDETDQDEVRHVPVSATTDEVVKILKEDGCVILDQLVPEGSVEELRAELHEIVADAPFGDNDFDGYATRRIYDPLARTRCLDELLLHPLLLSAIDSRIGPCQFGMTVLSDVKPGEVAQQLHRDSAVYPVPFDAGPIEINTIWAIDEFTRANGATVLSPGSHLTETASSESQTVALAAATMSPGSVLIYDGRLIHGAGRNHSNSTRLGLIVEHVVRWLRPAENHTLAVAPELVATLPTGMQERLGYNQYGQFLGFVNGISPQDWLISRFNSELD